MTDKVQKIREEVEKRYEYWREKEFNSHSIESEIRMSECQHLLLMLDSLQEEPVSEDLEEFARANANKEYPPEHEMADDNWKQRAGYVKGVKSGAKWQKEQMMAKAKSGTVQKDNQVILDNGTYIDLDPSMQLKPSFVGLKEGDRIKVIVIKEG